MARKNKATPGATTLGVVKIAPHVSASNKLGITQSSGSNLLGKNANTVARLPCLRHGVKIAPCATTLGVVDIAPYASPSNKLGINQSNGSILLGKNVNIITQLPCHRQGVKIAPSAMTLGIVDIATYASPSNKLGINQSNGSILLGKNANIVAQLPCLRQGVKSAPSATTLDVVDIASYASPSNKLSINQSNGSILLEKL
jgi:hypothetical protein